MNRRTLFQNNIRLNIFSYFFITLTAIFCFNIATQAQTQFGYTGANQTYTVPAGVTAVRVYMWGAGGGGGDATRSATTHGGGGGYVEGVLCVTPGENLTIIVGQGGPYGSAAASNTFGGGGRGGGNQYTGAGGGRSAIRRSTTELATAGGGGGGGETRDNSSSSRHGGVGGAGGGLSGRFGSGGSGQGMLGSHNNWAGLGGTQTAGGNGGYSGGAGAMFQGGSGQSHSDREGGGGGGGYYGGGGGRGSSDGGAGGGGGSSYIGGLSNANTIAGGVADLPNNSQQVAGNASHAYNGGNYGRGGSVEAAGQHGRVVIVPITVDAGPDISICGSSTQLNGTGITPIIYTNGTATTLPSYCAVGTDNSDNTGIVRVVFNTIDNNVGGSNNGYQDKTSTITNVTPNTAYTLQVWVHTAGSWTVYTRAWIDWNKDGDFADAGEEYILGSNYNTTNGATPTSPSITIPATATGSYRLRIRTTYNVEPTSCGNQGYTETEDYTIIAQVPPTYSWSGGPIVSGGTTLTPIVNPTVNPTVYTLSTTAGGCTITDNMTVNVNPTAGDPTLFGPNTWYVYAYNANTNYYDPPVTGVQYTNLDNTIISYAGWYTHNTLNIDSGTAWGPGGSPDDAPGYAGCPVTDDNHVFVYKRRGFPCGTYNISNISHDDAINILVDGVSVHQTTVCCGSNPNLNIELGGNSTVEIRLGENQGSSYLAVNFVPVVNTLAVNNDTKTCYVGANSGWNTFTIGNGRLLASIEPGASTLGNVEVTSYVSPSPFLVNACAPLYNPAHETAVLGRRWTITPATQPTNPVRVRLYFGEDEHSLLAPLSVSSSSPDDLTTAYSDLRLSKYHHPSNTAVNGSFSDNCANIPAGQMTMWNPAGANLISTLFTGFDANGRYTEYLINPPAFSEFWLHGSTVTSPLAITLANFSAKCNGSKVDIHWKTDVEFNSDYFTLERSRDGMIWEVVTTVSATGSHNSTTSYHATDIAATEVYYRLKETDLDGKSEYHGPIIVNCDNGSNELIVYPNPNNGKFTVAVNTKEAMGDATILVQDVTGKTVASQNINVLSGTNTVLFENTNLIRGTYIVSILGKEKNTFTPVKLVIQ